jgi:pSer/pThr/pTyr-binding forkhead associated (FHA) protein
MLFVPSGMPLRLDEGRIFVLGRSPDCDLPVVSERASRRHAHVFWERTGFVVRDLGSTNGTYVNDERVDGKRALQPGDRILVGDQAVTFCLIGSEDPFAGLPSDADTVVASRPPSSHPDALQGSLTEIPAFAVLQVLELGRKSGLLSVRHGDELHQVWFDAGRAVHAESGATWGEEAAFALLAAQAGQFSFQSGAAAAEVTVRRSVTELLLEASRLQDERAR